MERVISLAKTVAAQTPLIDIAEVLASMEYPGDSRERYALYLEWANEFNADFEARQVAGREPAETYLEDIEVFAHKRAAAYGFTCRGHGVKGTLYSDTQLEAAMQACTVLYEAFAVADADNGGASRSVAWESLSLAHDWAAQALSGAERTRINSISARENGSFTAGAHAETPLYLLAFPDFGRLDVTLPQGFIDKSWSKDSCPSFEIPDPTDPDAEWPLITVFIDYADTDLRADPGGKRFNLSLGAIQGPPDLETDDWDDALAFIQEHRRIAVLKGAA